MILRPDPYKYKIVASTLDMADLLASFLEIRNWQLVRHSHDLLGKSPYYFRVVVESKWTRSPRVDFDVNRVAEALRYWNFKYPHTIRHINLEKELNKRARWYAQMPEISPTREEQ